MEQMALPAINTVKDAHALAEQARRVAAFGLQDRLFKAVTFSFAALVMAALAGILVSLMVKAFCPRSSRERSRNEGNFLMVAVDAVGDAVALTF
jgi:ABC-type phosphate transport system permease subunit